MFEDFLKIFRELCSVPHGSGNTAPIGDYCVRFAETHGLRYIRDKSGNVIIFKNGTAGYESSPAVILQGHLDMVCVKTDERQIDFRAEGLTLIEEENFIWADGTSLGADDAVAIAYALAIAQSDNIAHPPLELVFTVDEEVGMLGAAALDASVLTAKRLINIDSEEENTLLVSCAGGVRADISLPIKMQDTESEALMINLTGFIGGHSGTEIGKGRTNAILAAARLIKSAGVGAVVSIGGGSADNAIPASCTAVVTDTDLSALAKRLESEFLKIKASASGEDAKAEMSISKIKVKKAMTAQSTKSLLQLLEEIPNGVISYSQSVGGLVQTSLNLGVIKTDDGAVTLSHALRSSVESEKTQLADDLRQHAQRFGADISFHGDYPAWEYKEDSVLREVICEVYERRYGKKMNIEAIHAGLECGLFCGKIEDLDCVSMGPDIFDIHTTDEKLSKKSAEKFLGLLVEVLEKLHD